MQACFTTVVTVVYTGKPFPTKRRSSTRDIPRGIALTSASVVAMAAPSALAALTPVTPIVQGAVKVLSTELVRFEGKIYRRIRLKEPRRDKTGALTFTKAGRVRMHTVTRMEPIDVSATLNPIGLGVLGVLGAATAFVLFGRIAGGLPLGGEFEIYKGPLADEFDAWRGTRATGGASSLSHSGTAVAAHVVTQPAAHAFTQPSGHSAHAVTQPTAHGD